MLVQFKEWGQACWREIHSGALYLFELAIRIGRCLSSRLVLFGAELGLMIWNGWDHWQARRQAEREDTLLAHLESELQRRKASRLAAKLLRDQLHDTLLQEEERSVAGREGPSDLQKFYEEHKGSLRGSALADSRVQSLQKTMHWYTESLADQLRRLPSESAERTPMCALLRWIRRDQVERPLICWAESLHLSEYT